MWNAGMMWYCPSFHRGEWRAGKASWNHLIVIDHSWGENLMKLCLPVISILAAINFWIAYWSNPKTSIQYGIKLQNILLPSQLDIWLVMWYSYIFITFSEVGRWGDPIGIIYINQKNLTMKKLYFKQIVVQNPAVWPCRKIEFGANGIIRQVLCLDSEVNRWHKCAWHLEGFVGVVFSSNTNSKFKSRQNLNLIIVLLYSQTVA